MPRDPNHQTILNAASQLMLATGQSSTKKKEIKRRKRGGKSKQITGSVLM